MPPSVLLLRCLASIVINNFDFDTFCFGFNTACPCDSSLSHQDYFKLDAPVFDVNISFVIF